ncbi:Transmembrane protein 135-like [Homarus americanus]|uniref:Transmembrane protein 135-like n=1 Tax=Homarus americanus TaxID=6706 RepID=A0A8J5JWY9_HOMAM|nr:Transmembrane protein 135-like [Homarus americanus]
MNVVLEFAPAITTDTNELTRPSGKYGEPQQDTALHLTGLIKSRKMSFEYGRKLLKDYMTSVCFLTVNAFGRIFRHINFLTASFLPGFIASLMAINVERPERRQLLAIYVTNASECLWNLAVGHGYVRRIPRGEILIFAGTMAVLGYKYRSSSKPFSRLINSILQKIIGPEESGAMISQRQATKPDASTQLTPKQQSWVRRLLSVFTSRHSMCPHKGGCVPHFLWTGVRGFSQGFIIQLAIKLLPSLPQLVRSPRKLYNLLLNRNNIKAGIFLAWLASVFKGTCCAGRWWHGRDEPSHGAVAGVLSALSMYFYSAPSLALYVMWKVVESAYEKGCDDGYLPRIPGSVELLYAVSVGFLFHLGVMEKHYMKLSYWRFLKRLTWGRMNTYNRHLLVPFGLDSARDYSDFWPSYDPDHIGEHVKQLTAEYMSRMGLP